jgi:hypothetical protein
MTYMEFERAKGDRQMTPQEEEHPGVAKVKAMWERGEFEKIDEMVRIWTALQNIGMLGGLVKRFLIWAGIIAATWLTASGWLTEYIRSIR